MYSYKDHCQTGVLFGIAQAFARMTTLLKQVCWRYLFGADCIAEERTSAFACALCPLQCCSLEVRQTAAQFGCPPCFRACM